MAVFCFPNSGVCEILQHLSLAYTIIFSLPVLCMKNGNFCRCKNAFVTGGRGALRALRAANRLLSP